MDLSDICHKFEEFGCFLANLSQQEIWSNIDQTQELKFGRVKIGQYLTYQKPIWLIYFDFDHNSILEIILRSEQELALEIVPLPFKVDGLNPNGDRTLLNYNSLKELKLDFERLKNNLKKAYNLVSI